MQTIFGRSGKRRARVSLFLTLPVAALLAITTIGNDANAAQAQDGVGGAEVRLDMPRALPDGAFVVADHERKKYKRKKYKRHKRRKFKHRPIDLVDPYPGHLPPLHMANSHCSSDLIGTLLGAAAGGLVGSQIGDGTGQMAAVGAGVLLGAILGNTVGASVDAHDRNCMAQTLTQAPDHQQVVWQNPDSGQDYAVTPTRSYDGGGGRYCREYIAEAMVGGQAQQTYGTACRQPDGAWQIVN